MENAAPTNYVTKALIEKSLRNFYQDNKLEIIGFSSKPVVATGDNYTSELLRVNVNFCKNESQRESQSIIIKIQPVGTQMEILTNAMNLFGKEVEMFSKTLPLMYRALGPKSKGCLSSLCLLTVDKPTAILVLEDLQPDGFKMVPRQQGLDYEHCVMVMKKIAKFHAASLQVIKDDPTITKKYSDGIYSSNDLLKPWMYKAFQSITEVCLETKGLEKYGEKLRKLGDDAIKRGIAAGDKRPGGFNVINHGDLWINNFLFSYHANGEVKDLKFVDFQIVKHTSPALDLHYFLSTSPTDEVRGEHLENLLDIYYGHLVSTLATMKYSLEEVPSLEKFYQDFKSRGFYGVIAAVTVLPLVKGDTRKDATFENLMQDEGVDSFRHHCYHNDRYLKSIKQIFGYFDKFGVFD